MAGLPLPLKYQSGVYIVRLLSCQLPPSASTVLGCLKRHTKSPNFNSLFFHSKSLFFNLRTPLCNHENLMSFNLPAFQTPQLQQPSPAVSRDYQRSPACSFTKGPRPTNNVVDLSRLSLASSTSSLPPPYHRSLDEESAVPSYGEEQEVQTMARYLFFYGFCELWQISPS
jgi:hypothetical protein